MKKIRKFTKPIVFFSMVLCLIVLSANNTMALGQYVATNATTSSAAQTNTEVCGVAAAALVVATVGVGAALVNAAYNLGTGIGQAAYHLAHGAAAQSAYISSKPYNSTDFSTFD